MLFRSKWDINGDDNATADLTFTQANITSVKVVNGTTLEVVLNNGAALEGTTGYDPLDTNDTVEIATGFSRDGAGNTSTTDAFEGPSYIPEVASIAISGSPGVQNNLLNAGDVVSVTVTMTENTDVTDNPQLALNIGGSTVQADYFSGSGGKGIGRASGRERVFRAV